MTRVLRAHLAATLGVLALIPACSVVPPSGSNPIRPSFPTDYGLGQTANQGLAQVPDLGPVPIERPPSIYAQSSIVVDIKSGKVLYTKDADHKRAVASTQKIITALCVLDAGDLDKKVHIASTDGNCEPTKLGLRSGEVYTRRELLKVLMVKSANDVARALARDVAGNQAAFARMMNRKCAQLGMRNSHFKNPHGLTEPGQYSTARDLAIAAMEAYKNPTLREFVATKSFNFKFSNGRSYEVSTTNKVLRELSYCNGMKTGTTRASGRCLVATGKINNRSVVVVVLNSNSRNVWKDATKLLRWSLVRPSSNI